MHSDLLTPLFATKPMRNVLSDKRRLEAMLAFEAALAKAEADTGLIPADAAMTIAEACRTFEPDIGALGEATRLSGNPAIPFIRALTAHCPEPGKGWVHWGATSQDVIDTAASLVGQQAMTVLDSQLRSFGETLVQKARTYSGTVMPGRTLLQPALPVTFGFKLAGWLDMLTRCRTSLKAAAANGLVLQFGGAVGTLAAIHAAEYTDTAETIDAKEVRTALGRTLGLPVADITWHTLRDRVARLGSELAILTAALAKMAGDTELLMQAEVGEASEPAGPGRGGSSTMPQKRNPVAAVAVRANATKAAGLAGSLIAAMPQEHERGAGGWHAEWMILPDLFELASGALAHMSETVAGIEVREERMRENLDIGNGTLMAEALMMALAPETGRLEAHHRVEAAARRAIAENRPLADICSETPEIAEVLGAEGIERALDPAGYLGLAAASVDTVVARWHEQEND